MFCYFVRKEFVPAITVMNGQAVCDDHTYYVQRGEFNQILALIKRDEQHSSFDEVIAENVRINSDINHLRSDIRRSRRRPRE